MIELPLVVAIALIAVIVAGLIGYAFGTSRFVRRLEGEVARARTEAWGNSATTDARRVVERDAAVARILRDPLRAP